MSLFGTWIDLTHSVINSLSGSIVFPGEGKSVSFPSLCPFSKRKARVSGAGFISMTLSAASPAAWKSSRPWREDPLLARARHVDVFARGEREKLLLWRQGWHCSTAGMLSGGAGGVSRRADANLYIVWQSVHPVCWPRRWQLAAWLPMRGFSLSHRGLWMDVSVTRLPPILTCRVPSH